MQGRFFQTNFFSRFGIGTVQLDGGFFEAGFLGNSRGQAPQHLSGSGLSVSEISEAVGFVSPAHFSHIFRKMEGTSPSAWRENPVEDENEPIDFSF